MKAVLFASLFLFACGSGPGTVASETTALQTAPDCDIATIVPGAGGFFVLNAGPPHTLVPVPAGATGMWCSANMASDTIRVEVAEDNPSGHGFAFDFALSAPEPVLSPIAPGIRQLSLIAMGGGSNFTVMFTTNTCTQ